MFSLFTKVLFMKKKGLLGALLGTVVEYYDYGLYGFAAEAIRQNFFPHSDPLLGLMWSYGVYAAGYLAKPLGAYLFGLIGDNLGRRYSLLLTIVGMALPTALIGLTPSFQTIGIWAPILVVCCRFVQGIFAGGEYDGAVLFIMEHIPKEQKSLGSALTRATGVLGLILANVMVYFFVDVTNPNSLSWRIPFLLSLPLALLTFYFRRFMQETPEFKENVASVKTYSFSKFFWQKKELFLAVVLLYGAIGGTYHLTLVFLKTFIPTVFTDARHSLWSGLNIFFFIILALSMIISGLLSRGGRKKTLELISHGLLLAFLGVCLLTLSLSIQSNALAAASVVIIIVGLSPLNCLAHYLVHDLFPVQIRYRALSLSHNLGSMLLSGPAPLLAMTLYRKSSLIISPALMLLALVLQALLFTSWLKRAKPLTLEKLSSPL